MYYSFVIFAYTYHPPRSSSPDPSHGCQSSSIPPDTIRSMGRVQSGKSTGYDTFDVYIRPVGEFNHRGANSFPSVAVHLSRGVGNPMPPKARAAKASPKAKTTARKNSASSPKKSAAAASSGQYPITVLFPATNERGTAKNQLAASHKAAFTTAASRWSKMIRPTLPAVRVRRAVIKGLQITAFAGAMDGAGGTLAASGPMHLRHATHIPATGKMEVDTADIVRLEKQGMLVDVITHEMGHILGIGTIWPLKKLVSGLGTSSPVFTGLETVKEYAALLSKASRSSSSLPPVKSVPLENIGGGGTAGGHWLKTVFGSECMCTFITRPGNPISRMTLASLRDLGYTVDLNAAEPYQLPPQTSSTLSAPATAVPACLGCQHRPAVTLLPKSAQVTGDGV